MLEGVIGEKVDGGVRHSRFAVSVQLEGVGFLLIDKSKKLTSLVSCVGLSFMLPWIVPM